MAEDVRTQEPCYLTTPEQSRSFIGRFVWMVTAKGNLSLTSESLSFTSKKVSFEIPLDAVTDIACGHHSRFAKPLKLNYMAVTYTHEGKEETVMLTPAALRSTLPWKSNELVGNWIASLNEAVRGQ